MPIHQADLHRSKKDQERVDPAAAAAFIDGEGDLADGLTLSPELVDGLRRQAHALLSAGHYQRTIDVVLAIVALGSVHPADPLMLADAYRALGMREAADQCQQHADLMLDAMGVHVPMVRAEDLR